MENFNSCCGLLRRKQQTNYNHKSELYKVSSNPIYAPMDYNKTNHFSHGTQMVTSTGYPPVKMSDIRSVAGGSAPDSISEYYKGGSYINAANQCAGSVPTSGQISFSMFYNLHADQESGTHTNASGTWNGSGSYTHETTSTISASATNTQTLSFTVCLLRLHMTKLCQRAPGGTYSGSNWSGSLSPGSSMQRQYLWGELPYQPGNSFYGYVYLIYTTASGSWSCNNSAFYTYHV